MALLDLQEMETPEQEPGAYRSCASHHCCDGWGGGSALSLLLC